MEKKSERERGILVTLAFLCFPKHTAVPKSKVQHEIGNASKEKGCVCVKEKEG